MDRKNLLGWLGQEGWVQSEAIPTVLGSNPGWLSIITFLYDPPGTADELRAPSYWVFADQASGAVRVWADSSLMDPLPADWEVVGSRHRRDAAPVAGHEALAIIDRHYQEVTAAFFASRPAEAEARHQVDLALRALLPPAVQVWVFMCCDDFSTWLDT